MLNVEVLTLHISMYYHVSTKLQLKIFCDELTPFLNRFLISSFFIGCLFDKKNKVASPDLSTSSTNSFPCKNCMNSFMRFLRRSYHVIIHVTSCYYGTFIVDKLEDCLAASNENNPVILPHTRILDHQTNSKVVEGGGQTIGLR